MVYLVTVSNSVSILLLDPLNVSVYFLFCFSSRHLMGIGTQLGNNAPIDLEIWSGLN